MPHFIIDCSDNIITSKTPNEIMQKVYDTAVSSTLFDPEDIKVRINPYEFYVLGESKDSFIHVFANIMEGRNSHQKSMLSKSIVAAMKLMFPDVPIISMNIRDFEKDSYCNKTMV